MSKKLVLIDGHSILNRAFYALPDLTNAEGLHTNAVYGFINILLKILGEEEPDYLMVAFDVHAPTFRSSLYQEYKGTRKPMPDELRQQVPLVKEVLQAMEIPIVEKEGVEADDVLGTIAKETAKKEIFVSIVSGDRDLLQLADERIKIRIPKTKMGVTEVENYNIKEVIEKYQVTPLQFIDLKALMGDMADNIPGVPGIGEKTATKIITAFGSIENAYGHVEEIKPNRAKEALKNHFELAELSKVLATIKTDCELSYDLEEAKMGKLFTKAAYQMFKRLEFKNLLTKFESNTSSAKIEEVFQSIKELSKAEEIFKKAKEKKDVGFQLFFDKRLIGISLAFGDEDVYYLNVEGFLTQEYLLEQLENLLQSCDQIATFDLKQAMHIIELPDIKKVFDVKIGTYLLNPLKSDYDYVDTAQEFLGMTVPEKAELLGKLSFEQANAEKEKKFTTFACYRSYVAWKSRAVLTDNLSKTGMLSLFWEIEMPLIPVLCSMEKVGIKVEKQALKEYGDSLVGRIEELAKQIYELAGEEFNINSPKQLGEILFERLHMPHAKKKKTGYSTSADVLDKLAPDYPIVSLVLEYRQLTKLKSTYADGLVNFISEDGRIHGAFHQTITATGRISSADPNLQNIPIRMELGRLIRKVFVPEPGYVFLDADYSQIELRVLAHLSQDMTLIRAYKEEQDIHRITASQVFHTPMKEVTSLQRRNAKAVNFGIVYGISSFGLSQDLSISKKEAATYIEKYFETYPRVKEFLDEMVNSAKEDGFTTTMFGRRRPVPELKAGNFMQRSFGERVAMNAPIQGTAADIIKIAMIRVAEKLKDNNLKSRLILQVHDELLIEAQEEELEFVKQILSEEMQKAATLQVPLEIDMHIGVNWYESK